MQTHWYHSRSPPSDGESGINDDLVGLVSFYLPVVDDNVSVNASLEVLGKDPVLGAYYFVVVPDKQIFLTDDFSVVSDHHVIVLGQFCWDIIQVVFSQFGSDIVGDLVLELGVKGAVKIIFEVVHGQESLEKCQSIHRQLTVVDYVQWLAQYHHRAH